MIFELLALLGYGYLLHQTKPYADKAPGGWRDLLKYSIGGVGILFAWPIIAWRYGMSWGEILKGELVLVVVLFGTGGGVVAGWILRTILAR